MEEKENDVIEKNEEVKEKKGINILKYFLFVILVGCLCAGCFFLGTTFTSSIDDKKDGNDKVTEETNEKEEDVQIEQLTKDSAVVKKLFEIFREDNYAKSDVWDNTEYTDFEKKMFIAYLSIDEKEFTTTKCGTLGATYAFDKTGFIFHCGLNFTEKAGIYYGDNNWEKFGEELVNNTTTTIKADKLRTVYETIFGKNSTYKDENLSLNYNTLLYYDSNSKSYAEFDCQCGGEMGSISQVIDDITQNGVNLTIHTTVTNYESNTKIDYNFEYEKETGNYIFVSRVAK